MAQKVKILKVGVVGARVRNTPKDKQLIRDALLYLIQKDKNVIIHLVSGGCPQGADRFAEELANELQLGISIHCPDKSKLEANTSWAYAKIAYARNTLIAEECDMLLATPAYDARGPVGGTADTLKKVDILRKPVVIL